MLLFTVLPGKCLLQERAKCEACQKNDSSILPFLWLKRFLFNSFIFLLSHSWVANKTEEFKGGHTSQKSGSCWGTVTSDAVTVLQLNCQRIIFSLLLRSKVLQGITQTFHMIQSARFLHLNRWDKPCGGWGEFTEFLRSCGYERCCVLHFPAKINFHLHSAEPSGLPWMTFGHWQVTRCSFLCRFGSFSPWQLCTTAFAVASGQNSTIPVPWAPSAPVVWIERFGLKRISRPPNSSSYHTSIITQWDVSPGQSRRKLIPALELLLCGGMGCGELLLWRALADFINLRA